MQIQVRTALIISELKGIFLYLMRNGI